MRPFFVLAHGSHGRACDLDYIAGCLGYRFPDSLLLQSKANQLLDTNDGLLVCGARLAAEVHEYLGARFPDGDSEPLRLVLVGHSLGGLILRAALPALLDGSPVPLVPSSYVSLQTPHLGIRRAAATGWIGDLKRELMHGVYRILGQTGRELKQEDDAGVLRALTDPMAPSFGALARFPHCTFVAMPHFDWNVPFTTASAIAVNPHPEPTSDDPPFYVASHRRFPLEYHPLLNDRLHRPPASLSEPDSEEPLPAPQRSSPSDGPETAAEFVADSEGLIEFDLWLQQQLLGLPNLRHLNVQFSPLWHPVQFHLAVIHQGLGKINAGRQCVALVVDVIALDLGRTTDPTASPAAPLSAPPTTTPTPR